MPLANLPPELHQLIIDLVAGKIVTVAFQPIKTAEKGIRDALRSFSLVCKDWHALTLRYTFHDLSMTIFASDKDRQRYAALLRLLEVNPLIGQCIRRMDLSILELEPVPVEIVEELCRAIARVETLRLRLKLSPRPPTHPSALDGLHHLLSTPHLRNLSISSSYLPISLLRALLNARSLTLQGVREVLMDGYGYGDRHSDAWRSSNLEELTVRPADRALNGIVAAQDVGLSAFFDNLKYLDVKFSLPAHPPDSQLHVLLARWQRLQTLVLRWDIDGESKLPFSG